MFEKKTNIISSDKLYETDGILYETDLKKPYTGKVIDFFDNGTKEREVDYIDGKKHGKYIMFYENGQKRWEHGYKNGKEYGRFITWGESGQRYHEFYNIDGKEYRKLQII